MAKRKIITIDEAKCNGCGACIPNCPEGALQVIEGKARLISDLFCDGLGACIGKCPLGAIAIEEREAEKYDEKKVMGNIAKQGRGVISAHLKHLQEHGEKAYLKQAVDFLKEQNISIPEIELKRHAECGCPGARIMDMRNSEEHSKELNKEEKRNSQLRQWPVQLMLVPPHAPYFEGADILIAADCVPFAYPSFHEDLLKGRILLVGCPKLDDIAVYGSKIREILKQHDIKSVTYAHMEVPCCSGLCGVIEAAIEASGKRIPYTDITISIKGERTEKRS